MLNDQQYTSMVTQHIAFIKPYATVKWPFVKHSISVGFNKHIKNNINIRSLLQRITSNLTNDNDTIRATSQNANICYIKIMSDVIFIDTYTTFQTSNILLICHEMKTVLQYPYDYSILQYYIVRLSIRIHTS